MSDNKLTRRNFNKATIATSFGILAASSRAIAASNSDTLKIGLLGCGGRGSGAAAQMLQGNENVKLVAMADIFEDRVRQRLRNFEKSTDERINKKVDVKPDHQFVGIDAYKEILKTDIDILIEGTLPYSRPKHVMAAIKAGKHVFTEKPGAVDPTGIRVLLEAAKLADKKGLSVVTGLQRRHQKSYVDTMKKIHDGAIGDVVAMRAYWCGTLPFVHQRQEKWKTDLEYRLRNWYNYCWACGDNIVEQHVHNLDVMNWVKGDFPTSVFASGGRVWKPSEERFGDIYDHFSCDYEYGDGTHLTSMCRHWKGAGGVFEEAVGTKGVSNCHDMGQDDRDPYVQEHINLVASVRETGPHLNELERMAKSTLTAIMGRMSAYTGKKITFANALKSDLSIVPDLDWNASYPVSPVPAPGAHKI